MEVLPDAVIGAIAAEVEPGSTVVGTSDLPGGLSSYMTTIRLERADGSLHRIVVRRGRLPGGERHNMSLELEFALLSHLHDHGIPVATPRAFDGSGRILPQPYLVLDFVEGTTPFRPAAPVRVARQMADVLAAVHDLDVGAGPLPSLPHHADHIQGWVISDLDRRAPDPTLREDLVRPPLHARWPPPLSEVCVLHGDYFPGNLVWDGDSLAAVIDWEAAALGDPMADVATTCLDLWWVFGVEVADAFVERYLAVTGRSTDTLPLWELVTALRPAGMVSLWARDLAAHGRPDVTAASMRTAQHAFVDRALARLDARPS